jgi:hypothetical protein
MNTHLIMECVRKRPIGEVADDNHQATVNMIARSSAYARTHAQARGRAPAPLPARVAMALAPLLNFSARCGKHVSIWLLNSLGDCPDTVTLNQ